MNRVPRLPRRAFHTVFLTAWLLWFILLFAVSGSPERDGDRYYNRDDPRTEITHVEYQSLRAAEQRLFADWSIGAMAMVILLVWGLPSTRTRNAEHGSPLA